MKSCKLLIAALLICLNTLFIKPSMAFAAQPLVNIHVTNAEIREVLTSLSAIGNISIIADDTVTGKISLQLADIPFETALDIITKTKGLSYQIVNNIIVVTSPEKMAKNFSNIQIIKLKYAKAEDIKKSLSLIIKENDIKVDEATNSILITSTPTDEQKIKTALAALDIPYQQVSLEAQVVAINKANTKDLGIDWEWDKTPTWPKVTESVSYDSEGKEIKGTKVRTVTRESSKGIIQFGKNPEGIPYEFYFQAKINALVSNGNAKVLAKPKIHTIDGKEAAIFIGDHIPVVTEKKENNQTTYSTEYVDAGIKLTYTPQINDDGFITAKVHTEVSTPTLVAEIKNYKITTRQADTFVRMKDGETMVIGGLIGNEESKTINKVPFLSELPILGSLFKSTHNTKSETEVVIFLTAKILK